MTTTETRAIAGTWTTRTAVEGGADEHVSTIAFADDHTLVITGQGPDGAPTFTGTGHWMPHDDGSFVYQFSHPLPNGFGDVHIIQIARVDGDALASQGQVVLHRADGGLLPPTTVRLTGTR